ncbi:hypothetical protein [Microcoleus sp. LEGE 07076]|uniref:hypothetical protein n=1 Tax=Microcoleus sp. LEGE 07076 TaxID=915322 RepID=UPI0030DD39B7
MGRVHPDLRLIVQIGEAAPRIKLDERIFGNLPTIRAIVVAWGGAGLWIFWLGS